MKRLRNSPEKILLPRGFAFSAVVAGIKASGRPDLGLIDAGCSTGRGAAAAALFTTNRVVAAPVQVGRSSLRATGGRVRAVVVNSGNANCATGKVGAAACARVCREAGKLLGVSPIEVFPSSTGIIGVPLPAQKIHARLPDLVAGCSPSERRVRDFARAIMTTDTRLKLASGRLRWRGREVRVLGIAKGAGMIHPQMATMLVYLLTDLDANPRELQGLLGEACGGSLNCMSIDGDTSTNDTVLLLANGQSGARLETARTRKRFSALLSGVCQSLAEQIISDGEGVEHVIRLRVGQARSREEALQVARTIAHSMLVKTAWAGADPNWGRILAAAGRSGVALDPARVQIFIGTQKVCRNGVAHPFNAKRAHRTLANRTCEIGVDLGRGSHSVTFLTTDLTAEYVRVNAEYST
jgi:glutamate N-acetyltransferase/amino-acid N-acetyltransferase